MTDQDQQRRVLAIRAALTYGFRPPHVDEEEVHYMAALITFVKERDWAAAHEILVGRPQAEWTPDDVKTFEQTIRGLPHPRHEFRPGVHRVPFLRDPGPWPATDPTLLELASRGLERTMIMRRERPVESLPIFISALLTTGEVLTGAIFERGDRFATAKMLIRTQPVFGFFIVFDAFMHNVVPGKSAAKVDCLLEHIATRDLRVMKSRPYSVVAGVVQFTDPPPEDVDFRSTTKFAKVEDPWADIFVSTPPSTGRPS